MQFRQSSLLDSLGAPGIHETSILDLFSGQVGFTGTTPVFAKPLRIMAFTNRCGSNLLADYLRQTGKIGGFHESLNHDTVAIAASRHSIASFPDYIRYLFNSLAVDGNLGVKASWDQMAMLSRWNIFAMFPGASVVHMRRSDVIGQAVSYWIAHQTRKWTSTQEGSNTEPVYDFVQIDRIIASINFSNATIPLVARVLNLPLTGVLYEGLTRDPRTVVTALGRAIALDLSDWTPRQPRISRQADATNQDFLERFVAELRDVLE